MSKLTTALRFHGRFGIETEEQARKRRYDERMAAADRIEALESSLPANLREFVEAVAHNFDSYDRESDEVICRSCRGVEVWTEKTEEWHINHRPDCIVLRARALLAADKDQA